MGTGEVVFIGLLSLPLIPIAIAKRWFLFGTFFTFYIIFGLYEWWSVSSTGYSISQDFWIYRTSNPMMGNIILGSMALMWIALLTHLTKKKEK